MRNQQNALLAGIAALALVAGAGLASAQDQSPDNKTAPHQMHQMNRAPAAGQMGQKAQDQDRNAGANMEKSNRQAQQKMSGNKQMSQTRPPSRAHMTRTEQRNKAAMAHRETTKTRTTAASEPRGLEGLQGNASGMNVRLNDEQRTRIRTTVVNARNAPRIDNAKFDVTVGTVIPRTGVRIVPVPATLVGIDPAWRGYRYFVWMDDVVIVNPRDMKIVAVVRV